MRPTGRSLPLAWFGAVVVAAAQAAPLFDVVHQGPVVVDRGITRGAAWGDYDGDGDPDLFITRPTYDGPAQHNVLYRNEGDGTFVRAGSGPATGPAAGWEGATWVDVDGDGDLDLHVVGRTGAGSMFFENDGGARLTRVQREVLGRAVRSVSMACWTDADGDGRLDVFVVGYREGRNALFRGVGSWRFDPVPLPGAGEGDGSGRACAAGDTDGDGLPEIVVANARRPNLLLRNRGAMVFVPDTTTALQQDTAYGYGLSWTDVNGDGLRDLFVANYDAPNSLYLGRRDGSLAPVRLGNQLQSPASKGHAWADFDLDGRVDLYVGSGTRAPGMVNRLYLAEGEGRFRLATAGEAATHADTSAAVVAADYDLDGDVDLFVANWGSAGSHNRLYRNRSAGRGWLRVALEGVSSNRMGLGARVSVLLRTRGRSRWLHRWLDSGTGYAGQNEPVIHFGLGEAMGVDSLVVRWPSGTVDRIGATTARTTVHVREGTSLDEARGADQPPGHLPGHGGRRLPRAPGR